MGAVRIGYLRGADMRVALVNSTYFPNVIGGAELSVQYLAEALVAKGHEVTVIAAAPEASHQVINEVDVHFLKLRQLYWPYGRRHSAPLRLAWNILDINNPWMAAELGSCLRRISPDVIHTNNLQGLSVAVWAAARRLNVPVVHTIRDLYLLCPRSAMFRKGRNCESPCLSCAVFAAAKRPASALVNQVVGISKYILDKHLSEGWFSSADRSVIFNSFEPVVIRDSTPKRPHIVFGYMGRIDRRKGIEWLLESFANMSISSQAVLVIAGEGEPSYVSHLQSRFNLPSVKYVGRTTQEDFFSKIDVAVVPSIIGEALGRVIIEAYAFGKPVIASRRGGIPEIMEDGRTGFLVDPDQPGQLVDRMRQFMDEPHLALKLRPACISRSSQFAPDRIANEYLDVYSAALDSRQLGSGESVCHRQLIRSGNEA